MQAPIFLLPSSSCWSMACAMLLWYKLASCGSWRLKSASRQLTVTDRLSACTASWAGKNTCHVPLDKPAVAGCKNRPLPLYLHPKRMNQSVHPLSCLHDAHLGKLAVAGTRSRLSLAFTPPRPTCYAYCMLPDMMAFQAAQYTARTAC